MAPLGTSTVIPLDEVTDAPPVGETTAPSAAGNEICGGSPGGSSMGTDGLSGVTITSKVAVPVAVRSPPMDDWDTVNVIVPAPESGAMKSPSAFPEIEPPASDDQL